MKKLISGLSMVVIIIFCVAQYPNGRITIRDGGLFRVLAGGVIELQDEAYGAGWDGEIDPPTKNAVYDAVEAVSSGGVSDGDKGDISVTSSGSVWTVDSGAITATKTSITGTPTGSKYLRDDWSWQTITGGVAWGAITGTLSSQTDLQTALNTKLDENAPITGATKTKITYDAGGLVTAGSDATTADIAASADKNYITDAQQALVAALPQTSVTGNSGTVTTVDAGGDTTTWVLLGNAQTGNQSPASDAGITYNSTTNALTASTFIGSLTGTASHATVCTTTNEVAVIDAPSATCQIAGFASTTASLPCYTLSATYNQATGNMTATTFTGALAGNATTATSAATLTTPRTINGVAFDGSANITITAVADAGTLTGSTLASGVTASSLQTFGTVSSIELGHATDTTITRTAAGMAAIEGKGIITRVIATAYTTGTAATHTFSAGLQYCEVWATGQGGGGGGTTATDATSQATGSGGGGGGTAYIIYSAAEAGSSAVYTVGTTGGGSGSSAGGDGTAGADTTFNPAGTGATITGGGGQPGLGHSNTTPAASIRLGGAGGNGSSGTANFTGNDGLTATTAATAGTTIPIMSGGGGGSLWGGAIYGVARATGGTTGGRSGQTWGGGGSGSVSLNSTGGVAGGSGAAGFILIKEYVQ